MGLLNIIQSNPTVTVIVTVFNRADTLLRAVDSVKQQSVQDWQLVIVDDGSTDDAARVVEALSHDRRIVAVAHRRNLGAYAAKNTGLDHATGDWIAFLDSDDELLPDALGVLLDTASAVDDGVDWVTCDVVDALTGKRLGIGLSGDQFLTLPLVVARADGAHWGMLRRSLIGDSRFNESLRGSEVVLWYHLSRKARRYYVDVPLYVYHREGSDRISRIRPSVAIETQCDKYLGYLWETEYVECLRRWNRGAFRRLGVGGALAAVVMRDDLAYAQAARLLRSEAPAFWIVASIARGLGPRIVRSIGFGVWAAKERFF